MAVSQDRLFSVMAAQIFAAAAASRKGPATSRNCMPSPPEPSLITMIGRSSASGALARDLSSPRHSARKPAIELALRNVRAIAARVEDVAIEPRFDVVIARAFADLSMFATVSAKHLAADGKLYAMKGALPKVEIAALPPTIEVVATIPLHVPGLDAERHLIVMQKRAMLA